MCVCVHILSIHVYIYLMSYWAIPDAKTLNKAVTLQGFQHHLWQDPLFTEQYQGWYLPSLL